LFSHADFVDIALPLYRQIAQAVKSAGLLLFFHSDGNIRGIIRFLIEAGYDCIHPVDAQAGMYLYEMKQNFGKEVSFMGHIDIAAWNPKRISAEIARAEGEFRDGGLILGSSCGIASDVSDEAVAILYPDIKNRRGRGMDRHKIRFLPSQRTVIAEQGKTVIEIAREAGVYMESPCGGKMKCGRCKIHVAEGRLSDFREEESAFIGEEERQYGYRLACAARIEGDSTLFIPEESLFTGTAARKEFSGRVSDVRPAVQNYNLDLAAMVDSESALLDQALSALRDQYGLKGVTAEGPASDLVQKAVSVNGVHFTASLWMEKEIIRSVPGWNHTALGIALDIGSTTVALYLCDLRSGEVIASGSFANPQIVFGADVISRITYSVDHPQTGVRRMQEILIRSINEAINDLTERAGYKYSDVLDMTAVGNTVMHHIFLGVAPDPLGFWPFEPSILSPIDVKARDLGIKINPTSYLHLLPVEAGFVGADNVAVLISQQPYIEEQLSLIIDIGTNGEVVLGNKERLLSCSCAIGTALEGATISCGMRGIAGAIEKVRIDPDTLDVDYQVVGEEGWASEQPRAALKPKGICGSGMIDALAQLFAAGIIGKNGAFTKDTRAHGLRTDRKESKEFVLVSGDKTATGRAIAISQHDIRQLQLAKAAVRAGCQILMSKFGIDTVENVTIAGDFGMHVDKKSALTIGFFPPCNPENVYFAGNAAGHGAYLALMDVEKRIEAERIAKFITHVELAKEEKFHNEFVKALSIP